MSESVPSLIEGYEPRDYLRFDFHILEVFRDLAEDIEGASPAVVRAAVFLTSLFHFRTQGHLRYQVRDPEMVFREVSLIWSGQGNTWLSLSYRDLSEALHGMFGKNTVRWATDFLNEIGLVEKSVPEDSSTANNAARYRFNGARARELFAEQAMRTPDRTPSSGQTQPRSGRIYPVSDETQAMSGQTQPESGETQAISDERGGQSDEIQGLIDPKPGPASSRSGPGFAQAQALVPLDPPIYRERKETREDQRALSRELCGLLAAELDSRLPGGRRNPEAWVEKAHLLVEAFPDRFDYLAEMMIWTQQHDFWATRITNMSSFHRNIDSVSAQYEAALSEQDAKVYKIDERR